MIKWRLHVIRFKKLPYKVSNMIQYRYKNWYIINAYLTVKNIKKFIFILKNKSTRNKNKKIKQKRYLCNNVKNRFFIWANLFKHKKNWTNKEKKKTYDYNPFFLNVKLKKKSAYLDKYYINKSNNKIIYKKKHSYWKNLKSSSTILIISNNEYQLQLFDKYLSKWSKKIQIYNKWRDGSFINYIHKTPKVVLFFNSRENGVIKKILFRKNYLVFSVDSVYEEQYHSSYSFVLDTSKKKSISLLFLNLIVRAMRLKKKVIGKIPLKKKYKKPRRSK